MYSPTFSEYRLEMRLRSSYLQTNVFVCAFRQNHFPRHIIAWTRETLTLTQVVNTVSATYLPNNGNIEPESKIQRFLHSATLRL